MVLLLCLMHGIEWPQSILRVVCNGRASKVAQREQSLTLTSLYQICGIE